MRDADHFKRSGLEFDADFFPALPNSRRKNTLTRLEVTADGSIVAVLEAGVGAAREQDGLVTNQEDVSDDGQLEPQHEPSLNRNSLEQSWSDNILDAPKTLIGVTRLVFHRYGGTYARPPHKFHFSASK